jgi:DNA-binding CsgD family transcriptional regulator
MTDSLAAGREAFARRSWHEAMEHFRLAEADGPLPSDDAEKLATSLHLMGREAEGREVLVAGYYREVEGGRARNAARLAFWVGHGLMFAGDDIQSSAWFGRARELLDDVDCAESGMVMIGDAIRLLFSGDPAGAERTFSTALDIGRRCQDAGLVAMGSHGRGRSLIALGRIEEGMAQLDEVMMTATEGRVPPIVVGDLYCGVLEACHDVFDYRRAREWTSALMRWCESQPDLVPYRGPCLVHRVELLRFGGEWQDALTEARKACEWLSAPLSPEGPGDAYYQIGELHRLRGEFAEAEEAYREASRHGKRPDPGLALFWLGRGQIAAARTAVSRALEEAADDRVRRAELLGAYVEVLLAAGDHAAARLAARELAELAGVFGAAALSAAADSALGRVLIAEGSPAESLSLLRKAWTAWQRLDAPFESARVRVQIGIAYRALGDVDSAAMEFDAARWVFQELGAAPDLAKLDAMAPPLGAAPLPGGLTTREADVLRLIAAGRTNREIAAALFISEHTVARHVQNMLAKLGFASRTRLAAFAIEQGLGGQQHSQN